MKTLRSIAILLLSVAPIAAHAQATIPVTGARVFDSNRNLLTGQLVFTVTNINNVPVTYTVEGGSPSTAAITIPTVNGVVQQVGGFPAQIPNPSTMTPANTRYDIKVQTTGGGVTYFDLPQTNITQAFFSYDGYSAPAGVNISGLGLPKIPCDPSALYTDTTQTNTYPWVCSILKSGGSIYWTQNPSENPACQGQAQAAVSPIAGSVFCTDSTNAYGTPGLVIGSPSPGSPAGPFAVIPAPDGGAKDFSSLTGNLGVDQGPSSLSGVLKDSNGTLGVSDHTDIDALYTGTAPCFLAKGGTCSPATGATFPTNALVWGLSPTTSRAAIDGSDYLSPSTGVIVTPAFPLGYEPSYQAFGDSITHGQNTVFSQFAAFPYKLAAAWNGTDKVEDYGVSGSVSGQNDNFIFTNLRASAPTSIVSYMIGTNNVTAAPTDPNAIANYQVNTLAQYALLGLPTSQVFTATSSNVTLAGTWTAENLFGTKDPGKVCTGTSCAVTVTGTGTTFYIVVSQTAAVASTVTLICDGTPTGVTPTFGGAGGVSIVQPQTALYRVTGLSAVGTHSCGMQSTSATRISFVWASYLTGTPITNSRVVLAYAIPPRVPDTNDVPWRAAQQANITTLEGDGLTRLVYVDTTTAFTAAVQNFTDGVIHPVEFNHYKMAGVGLAALNAVLGTSMIQPAYAPISGSPIMSGASDSAVGPNSLAVNTTGSFDSAIGDCLPNNTTGSDNTCNGTLALGGNTLGNENTANGSRALSSNLNGSMNTADGAFALTHATSGNNTASGALAGGAVSTGQQNSLYGSQSAQTLTTGNLNSCFGYACGSGLNPLTTDNGGSYFGSNAGKSTNTVLTNSGGFGTSATVSANNSYEIGTGNCNVANALCFQGSPLAVFPVSTATPTFTAGAGVTSVTTAAGYTNSNSSGELTIVGGTATTGTIATVNFGGIVTGVTVGTSGGTGYALGNTVTFSCGVSNAVAIVTAVTGTTITNMTTIQNSGNQCVSGTNVAPIATSGTGTGLLAVVGVSFPSPSYCEVTQNGGTAYQALGHSVPGPAGFSITSGVTVAGVTLNVDYFCKN